MYTPKAFEETNTQVLHEFMRRYSFAVLVTTGGAPVASHLPFLLDPHRGPLGTLRSHVALANPQWRMVDGKNEALVIFQGPHAYISPSWYKAKLSVPTWNYVAIHAYGRPRIIEDQTAFRALLKQTTQAFEAPFPQPWQFDDLPEAFVDKMQAQIVGIEMEITRLEGKFKLNQNRTAVDQQSVVDALNDTADPLNLEIAKLMAKHLEH